MPKTHPRRYRIEALILQALAPMLVSALPGGKMITIRQVSLNRDFSTATVIYTTVGDQREAAQAILGENTWRYRRQLATTLNMRKTPQLVFIYDDEGLAADKMRDFLETIKPGEASEQ